MGADDLPPGNAPLIEGLDPSWNDVVNYIPEDKRGEFAPLFKEKVTSLSSQYEAVKPWEDWSKTNNVTTDQADYALNLARAIETNPRDVYDTIGKHLGITAKEAEDLVEEVEDETGIDLTNHPAFKQLKAQNDAMAQIMLNQRQQDTKAQQDAAAEAELNSEFEKLRKKHGDIDEDEILARMYMKQMSAEQAYEDYNKKFDTIRQRRPAPFVLSNGAGTVPARQIDPRKLSNADTKSVVAQMLANARQQAQQ